MLGRFLEISVETHDAKESLDFYESLGFVQAVVGEIHRHPYAVVTDGRLFLGLHQREVPSPALTFVRTELAGYLATLQRLGIDVISARLDEESFHELEFQDPSGQSIRLIEARTFSPPSVLPAPSSTIGYFEEFGIPTLDLESSSAFWESLGFVAFDPERAPFTRVVATSSDINLGLYDLDLRRPVLCFSDPDMSSRLATLRDSGHRVLERLPRGMDPERHALLEAPEGTWLLLTTVGE